MLGVVTGEDAAPPEEVMPPGAALTGCCCICKSISEIEDVEKVPLLSECCYLVARKMYPVTDCEYVSIIPSPF